jgi:molybdopterin-containing oxidoreductase family membrane subunit
MLPLPNDMGSIWPQFRSPLMWDVFAVTTYLTTSLLFWYMGMVPDLATFRDRNASKGNNLKATIYGVLSLGWRGSARQWHRYERAYLILAGLATPLVFSVHSVVSFDFATSQVPGWHTTIFPPYFVAGAIYGGFAMVLCLAIPAREFFGLRDIITLRHIDNMCKIMLGTGIIVAYAYMSEFWVAWYSGNHFEQFTFLNRARGPYMWSWIIMTFCNAFAPQILWWKKARTTMWIVMIVAILANVGMWFERFEIIATSLTRDFLPSSWFWYRPTVIDLAMLAGSFGLFFTLFLLFCKYLPVVAMAEVKTVLPQAHPHTEQSHAETTTDYWPDRRAKPEAEHGSGPVPAPAH